MKHYVYIIKSLADGILYKGYSTDYLKRLEAHNRGESRYTSKKIPWVLVYAEELPNKTMALIREKQLKRANTNYLEWLMTQPTNLVK
ncbi:MAG: GIY-YIG nuclease family protein [Bacteroidetes bacterium]|nr:GIY-YIG nuclease family protein [Bacteroidota bacterium]